MPPDPPKIVCILVALLQCAPSHFVASYIHVYNFEMHASMVITCQHVRDSYRVFQCEMVAYTNQTRLDNVHTYIAIMKSPSSQYYTLYIIYR